jgi:hypothetical protein
MSENAQFHESLSEHTVLWLEVRAKVFLLHPDRDLLRGIDLSCNLIDDRRLCAAKYPLLLRDLLLQTAPAPDL